MLDEKLLPIIKRQWRGRTLPFPILLDSTGDTVKNFGIAAWPTSVLIDPEGCLVKIPDGMNVEEFLASKLAPIPPARRIACALDRDLALFVRDDITLADQMTFLSRVGHIKIEIDSDELKSTGLVREVAVPLSLSARLTLRAWLNLSLEPFALTYVADGESLRVVRRTPVNNQLGQPSPRQQGDNARVTEKLAETIPFDFHDEPLNKVVEFFQTKTKESFVLDPIARHEGLLKPTTTITGANAHQPLAVALDKLLEPAGMTYVVRDEVVVLTKKP